jgi:hypothetical protein
LSELQTHDLDQ